MSDAERREILADACKAKQRWSWVNFLRDPNGCSLTETEENKIDAALSAMSEVERRMRGGK